jgi:hypothetical protein
VGVKEVALVPTPRDFYDMSFLRRACIFPHIFNFCSARTLPFLYLPYGNTPQHLTTSLGNLGNTGNTNIVGNLGSTSGTLATPANNRQNLAIPDSGALTSLDISKNKLTRGTLKAGRSGTYEADYETDMTGMTTPMGV